ncbi:MAG: B12-binding domain-containing radical SAM protein, partial [Spirochaetes bacterium]|nr:B12-binding domain-containing radical SAM protein [Spirochaetota bacterium]
SWVEIYGSFKHLLKVVSFMPPLGLIYLAAYLEENNHTVKVIDADAGRHTVDDILNDVKSFKPDLIGVTGTTPVFNSAKTLIQSIAKKFDIPIIMGGVHLSVMPEDTMEKIPEIKVGVIGEGEETLLEIVRMYSKKKKNLNSIKGIVYREKGKIKRTPVRPAMDLNKLPMPDRELLDLDYYLFSVPGKGFERTTLLATSRGCPYSCTFCSSKTIWGQCVRLRDVENVLDEIDHVVNKLNIKYINFSDDTFTLNRNRIIEICEGIKKRNLDFKWEAMSRANLLDEELLKLMKETGLTRLSIGIESGDPEILKRMKKGIELDDIRKVYKLVNKLKIETRGSLMIGHPYETKKSVWNTFKFIRKLKGLLQVYINIATPFPGTEMYEMALKGIGGTKLLTKDFSQFRRYGNAVMEVNDLSRDDLIRLQKIGFLYFYLTPRRIVYNLYRAGFKAAVVNLIAFIRGILKV